MVDYGIISREWAVSSVGRARRSQCRGRGFEPHTVHHRPFPSSRLHGSSLSGFRLQ